MSDFSGRKIAIGIGKEATRQTAVAPSYWLGWMTTDLEDKAVNKMNESAINLLDKNSGSEIVETHGEGKIDGLLADQSFGLVLYALLGSHSVATHAGETVVYDHTFTESQLNASQSMTLTRKDPNVDNRFPGAMIKSLSLDVVSGDYVKMSSDWYSLLSVSGSDTATFIQENHFTAKMATAKLATNVAGLTGASAIKVKDIKLTAEKGVKPYAIIGQNNPDDIFATEFTVKGDFTLRYTDDTYKTLRFNNTPQAVLLDIKNTGVTLGVSTNPELQITLPLVYLTEWKLSQSIDGMVEQTISFEGTATIANPYTMQAVFTNSVATY